MFFAENIFLFTKATCSCCFHLKDILDKFCSCSGQLIGTPKSKLFFSSNLRCQDKDCIYGILSVSTIKQIGTYLGTPIFTSRRKVISYQFIIDKIRKKIEGWQTRYLFVPGRVMLIKSTTNTISIYSMQTTLLCEKLVKK